MPLITRDRATRSSPVLPQGKFICVGRRERSMLGIIYWIIVGLIAGWLTGKIMSGGGYGPLMDIIVGILGALLGGFIMSHLGFAGSGGLIYTIIVAVIGAVILTLLLRLVTRGRVRQV